MAEFSLQAGAKIDILTKPELDTSLADWTVKQETAKLEGIKWMRLPEVLVGTASSSKLSIDGNTGPYPLGPKGGFIWSIRRLVISGLTSGASPDIVNLYKGAPGAGVPLWQFNGNNFGYTFGKLELTLMGGETLSFQSVGTFASTGQITVGGELIEVPAALAGKLA